MTDQGFPKTDEKYMEWLPKLHQFSFVRNDSWLQSVWLAIWGVILVLMTFLYNFVAKPPIMAIYSVLFSFGTGTILCLRLIPKFLLYGLTGFLTPRNISVQQLIADALARIRATQQRAE
jgi:hypothetical protein